MSDIWKALLCGTIGAFAAIGVLCSIYLIVNTMGFP